MEKIFVVVPNWNGAEVITACLKSLEAQTHKVQIVVVDNGSVDESVSIIQAHFPKVHLIRKSKNLGFAGGVNAGIRYAIEQNAYAVALFNNDAVAHENWLRKLAETMDTEEKAGIVTCKLLRKDKEHFDSTGDFYSVWGMPFPRGRNQKDKGQYDQAETVFGASGGASLYSVAMLEEIGLFDERFFAYYEDVDISFRAQLADWKVFYNPEARVYHEVSATSSKLGSFSRYHSTKNLLPLYLKNMPGKLFWKCLPLFLFQMFRLAGSSLLRGGGWAYLQGLTRAILNLPYTFRERRRIQSSRKVSVAYIGAILYKQRPPRIPKLS